MRLQAIDVYILDYFRRTARARVLEADLSETCATYGCTDVNRALTKLEHDAHMLRRIDGSIELTREGRRYAGLAAIESSERFELREEG